MFAEQIGSVISDARRHKRRLRGSTTTAKFIWSRKERGALREIKEVKQLVRDRIASGRSLGHADNF